MASSRAKLALGAAQFGLDYGLTSTGSAVPEAEVRAILDLATASGITLIDTAAAYGGSEATLGRCGVEAHFKIITKLQPLPAVQRVAAARQSLRMSLARLGLQKIHGLLLHRQEDLAGDEGAALYDQLRAWKQDGVVERIGVSVYAGSDAEQCLDRFKFDVVQIPLSLFDQRPLQDGSLRRLASQGVEIHARSVLLQGLLLMASEHVPAHLEDARAPLAHLHAQLVQTGLTPLQAALAFVRDLQGVSAMVIGVHARRHLQEILDASGTTLPFDAAEFAQSKASIIDPRQWRSA